MSTLQTTLATDQGTKADTEEELATTKGDQAATLSHLESLTKEKAALHGECDFLIANFDATQAAMQQEVEALVGAMNILSGAMG